ncbi:MAG: hypothetical protein HYY93_07205 [Planctomycetes bacterium]|nr:hypothetical protein [Planctomycetota bacterium]
MLEKVDLSREMSKEEYKKVFQPLQDRLRALQRTAKDAGIATTVVFEGWDASGKGSMINLLLERMDPRGFKVHPTTAPNIEEIYRPFLWRFWIRLPGYGEIAVFDRSWYGRALVERIDKLTPKADWQRAYQEINDFERNLTDDGQAVVKFFMHISRKEQRKRFRKCEKDPILKWKVTEEDWKHHRQYKKYYRAVEEMLEKTSTQDAPWHIIESTDDRWARVEIFRILIEAMEARLRAKVVAQAAAQAAKSATVASAAPKAVAAKPASRPAAVKAASARSRGTGVSARPGGAGVPARPAAIAKPHLLERAASARRPSRSAEKGAARA